MTLPELEAALAWLERASLISCTSGRGRLLRLGGTPTIDLATACQQGSSQRPGLFGWHSVYSAGVADTIGCFGAPATAAAASVSSVPPFTSSIS
jgi:hypothetical protein